MTPTVSIVIPAYNAEHYIVKCLDSVIAQSICDYEVILVNDGSTDNTKKIVSEYIHQNNLSNFHLINKNNSGHSSARNTGLSLAKGKWIFFLDSDDWLESDCFESLLSVADKNDADLIIGGYQTYNQVTTQTEKWSDFPCDSGLVPERST